MEPRFRIVGNEVVGNGKTYIASPELKAAFGDKEFGEKDFVVGSKPKKYCKNGEPTEIAYPAQESQSQEDLWKEFFWGAPSAENNPNYAWAVSHYEIKRKTKI
jgi:hypothetical protein